MKHSILLKVGDNLIYQCTENEKPIQTTVDSLKDFIVWQNTLKSYLVKKEDEAGFNDLIIADQLIAGMPIPYELIELSEDKIANRKYAKINKNVKFDKNSNKILSVGFTCKICDVVQDVSADSYDVTFKVCKTCIGVLKKFVLSKK